MTERRSSAEDTAAAFRARYEHRVGPPGTKLCTRCRIRPAIAGRPGQPRCTECAAKPVPRRKGRRYRSDSPRARTISRAKLRRDVLTHAAIEPQRGRLPDRPVTRGECRDQERPCPWVGCRHHLYLEANPETGSIKINFPDIEPWELKHTCALDIAERGGITLEEIAEILNLTRERVRQVEVQGLLKLKMASPSPDELGADLLKAARAGEVLP